MTPAADARRARPTSEGVRPEAWFKGVRAYLLIALISLAAALPGVFTVPPLDRDESRFAQATAQMLETGDFIRIQEQDQARNKKPVGIYWLQAASVALFSNASARAIWAYRLPSVLGALLTSLATLWAGTALFDRKTGFWAGALMAVSVLLSTEGMIAKTDAMLCAATAVAMGALAHLYLRRGSGGAAFVFWVATAIGVLVKGPITPLVGALSMATLAVWERRAAWMKPLLRPSGVIAFLALTLPWFVAIQISTGGQFAHDALTGDMGRKLGGADEGHAAPPGYYIALLPFLAFPISTALPGGIRLAYRELRTARDVSAVRFILAWAAPIWLLFELMPTKLFHYTLPAYPALALLGAAGVCAQTGERGQRASSIVLFALAAFALAGVGGFVGAIGRHLILGALVLALCALAVTIRFARTKSPLVATAIAVATSVVFAIAVRNVLLPTADGWFISARASAALEHEGLHPRLSPHAGRLVVVGYAEPSLVFLTRTDTLLATPDAAAQAAQPNSVMLVENSQRRALDRLLAHRDLVFRPIGASITGFDYSNHRNVALQPGRVGARAHAPAPPS